MPAAAIINPTTIAGANKTARSLTSPIMTPSDIYLGSAKKPDIAIDCRPKRNGNTPTMQEPPPFGGGEIKSARITPTVRVAKARGMTAEMPSMAQPRSGRFRQIPSACTIPPPMFLNGWMIAGTNLIKAPRTTARPGPRVIADTGSSGAVLSIIIRRSPGQLTGPRTRPT